ncbi:Uncharacterised protein [Mycolicibacterium gilvum]|uniref:Uncharacterized protein n=1 Tax=Mycolicibacterium gilvum TaxID=1804 RepID=A0A378SL34_9MYCO|nr:Uncharacterised protein [Mycolicibacterium gilvum]
MPSLKQRNNGDFGSSALNPFTMCPVFTCVSETHCMSERFETFDSYGWRSNPFEIQSRLV